MKIRRHKHFIKQYKKLPSKFQAATENRISLFIQNRKSPLLRDHPLSGDMKGQRSFSVTGDYRIIYEERQNGEIVFVFLDIGTHSQVY